MGIYNQKEMLTMISKRLEVTRVELDSKNQQKFDLNEK